MTSSRRTWLRQAAFSLAAVSMGGSLCAEPAAPKPKTGLILLNSNENAFGPSKKVIQAMTLAASRSNRYPRDEGRSLAAKIAAHHGVSTENIVMTAGSSEILGHMTLLVARARGNAVTAEPSFNPWIGIAESFGVPVKRIPVDHERRLDLQKMLSAIDGETKLVYVCNPNNPVGNFIEHNKLRSFVEECSKKCMVVVDEAYTEFTGIPSLADLTLGNRNVVVAKTFSKIHGLAGARIGYAIAHPDTISQFNAIQSWPNGDISQVSMEAASAALDDKEFVNYCASKTAEAREKLYATLKELRLEYIPSVTSFVMFNIDPIRCDYEQAMNKKNILVQHRKHFGGKWCRVSMGTLEEMDLFCKSLREIC